MQPKSFFAKANMSMLHHFSKIFTGSQSKKGYFSRKPPLPFVSLMVPCHHICHPVSLCTLHLILWWKKLFPVQDGNSRALVTRSFSVQAPLVWNSLPPHIRYSCSLSQFKTSLKTFLFTSAFSKLPWFPRRSEIFSPPHRLLMFVCCWFVSKSESDC